MNRLVDRPFFQDIGYASCWEDPAVLRQALRVQRGDRVLSIASGGCNALALLLDDPAEVVAVDFNPHQLRLIRLKLAAIQCLNYEQLLAFIGVTVCSNRLALYQVLRSELDVADRAHWDNQPQRFKTGLYRWGRTDRYLMRFGSLVRLLKGRAATEAWFDLDAISAQATYYEQIWNTRGWRWCFEVFFHRAIMSRAKDRSHFAFVDTENFGRAILQRVRHQFVELAMSENYFLSLILLGRYPGVLPPYLSEAGHAIVQARTSRVILVEGTLDSVLQDYPIGYFQAFNLSNLHDWVDEAQRIESLKQLKSRAADGARLCYWNTLMSRPLPKVAGLTGDRALAERLRAQDRFPYAHFEVATIG